VTDPVARQRISSEMVEALRPHLPRVDRDAEPSIVDVGFSNSVVRFGGSVARVARTSQAAEGHVREARTVQVLSGRLPVEVPGPFRLVPPGPGLPSGAAIAPWLAGDPMTSDAASDPIVARQIAATLAAIHDAPPADFPDGALLELDPLPEIQRLVRETTPWLRERLSRPDLERLETRWADCRNDLPERERVVCHGDAWFGNMLMSRGRFSALVDWEDACVADPALDLAAQRHLEGDAPDAVIGEYVRLRGRTDELERRIEGYRLVRETAGLAYLLRNGIAEELDDAFSKVVSLLD
jgi:aminoglycoside phosphotransferase (APT) family kinase protein